MTTTEFTEADLLPHKRIDFTHGETLLWYTPEQVIALVNGHVRKLMQQEPVGVTDMAGDVHWKQGAPIQAKLYAAPLPQANESEAVKVRMLRLAEKWERECTQPAKRSYRLADRWREGMETAANDLRIALSTPQTSRC